MAYARYGTAVIYSRTCFSVLPEKSLMENTCANTKHVSPNLQVQTNGKITNAGGRQIYQNVKFTELGIVSIQELQQLKINSFPKNNYSCLPKSHFFFPSKAEIQKKHKQEV